VVEIAANDGYLLQYVQQAEYAALVLNRLPVQLPQRAGKGFLYAKFSSDVKQQSNYWQRAGPLI
jgi:hypothetical protein